jgi:hypothetical protein
MNATGPETTGSNRRRLSCFALLALGVLIELGCLETLRIGDLRAGVGVLSVPGATVDVLLFWFPFSAMFLFYAAAVYLIRTEKAAHAPSWAIPAFLALAVAFRITLLFSPPTLSDDIYRYLWDGRTQNAGINPYLYAPQDPAIAHLRDAYYAGINNRDISTIYPPLTQTLFRVVDGLWHSPYAMKILFTLCDLAVIILTLTLLRRRRLPANRILIYAWNPLVLVECAGSGHNDTLALALMLAGLLAVCQGRAAVGMIGLALSFLAKFFAVVLIPAIYRHLGRLRPFLLIPVLIILFYLPYLDAGYQLFHGLLVYGDKWRFNESLFSFALSMTGSLNQAKLIIGVVFSGLIVYLFIRPPDLLRTGYIVTGAYILLTPTLQPWYLIWIVPFLCLYPNRAWMLLTGLVVFSYHVLIQFAQTGIWKEDVTLRYVQYLPFYALLIFDALKLRVRKT